MTISIRPRDRDTIIQALSAGVVPRVGLQHIQVGRVSEVKAAIQDIDRIADKGGAFRVVIGPYGAGKTFYLNLVRSLALEKRLVTMQVDLAPDRRLHASGGQARNLYQEAVRTMATRAKPEGGALQNVVERLIGDANQASAQPELRLQVRGYREPDPDWETRKPEEERLVPAQTAIVAHLHQTLRGRNNLVFASRRQEVESVADALGRLSESKRVPNEFFPHHGSLSKALREELEERLKSGELPTTAVATTTLELGIDIGSVTSVAQVGPPASVAGLRQRLGRSGRREGEPSVLRIYVREPDRPAEDDPFERLRLELVQAVAAVNILVSKWVEPGGIQGLHLSTLLHQTLALICERGGARARDMFRLLCGPGPFAQVSEQDYAALLRAMSDAKIIEQSPDGILMLGSLGETITNRFDFYAVFMTDDEYRIVTDQRTLGTVPIFNPLRQGDFLTFAGRRWIVLSIDDRAKVVMVKPAPAGRVPLFPAQEGIPLHDRLVQEMRGIYRSETSYPFLDLIGKTLLQEARDAYRDLGLDSRQLLNVGDDIYLFVWRGTKATETVRLALASQDIRTEAYSVGLHAKYCELEKFSGALHRILQYPPTAHDVAAFAEPLRRQKYDIHLPDPMLRDAFARTRVDLSVLEATNSLPSAV